MNPNSGVIDMYSILLDENIWILKAPFTHINQFQSQHE